MPSELSWRLDHGKLITSLDVIDVFTLKWDLCPKSLRAVKGAGQCCCQIWGCDSAQHLLSLPLLSLAPVSSHSGPALRTKLAGNYSVYVGLILCMLSLLWSLSRTWIMHQIKPKLVKRLRAHHGTSGPQSALTVTASCSISWRLFLSCSGNAVPLQKTSSSLCRA